MPIRALGQVQSDPQVKGLPSLHVWACLVSRRGPWPPDMLGWDFGCLAALAQSGGLFPTMLPSSGGRGNWLPFRQLNQVEELQGSLSDALILHPCFVDKDTRAHREEEESPAGTQQGFQCPAPSDVLVPPLFVSVCPWEAPINTGRPALLLFYSSLEGKRNFHFISPPSIPHL